MSRTVAIIGGGFGGLSAAIYLAHAGYNVSLYEQNDFLGGKAGSFEANGFRFDTGPSLLTMPFVFENMFSQVGQPIEEYVHIERLSTLCTYFYEDGTRLTAFGNQEKFATEIAQKTKDTKESVIAFLEYSKRIYDLTAELFLFNSFSHILKKPLPYVSKLTKLQHLDPFRSMHDAITSYFTDRRTIQLFDRYATYNGSDPYKVPATLNIIPHVEYALGGYTVKGGIFGLSKALHRLADRVGVTIHLNTPVQKIMVSQNKVIGILVNDTQTPFDLVISNADVMNTYQHLLTDAAVKLPKKLKKLEPSSSALIFYWGINKEFPELDVHNIFFAKNYKEEFESIFDKNSCYEDPTVYINITSKYEKEDAPNGMENWFVMINVPYNSGQDWTAEAQKAKAHILEKLERLLGKKIQEHIIYESIMTPFDIENKTSSYRGSIYGVSSNTKTAAFLRQQNKSKEIKGLFFCGGSTHPGGGMPLAVLSGKITADIIKKEYV